MGLCWILLPLDAESKCYPVTLRIQPAPVPLVSSQYFSRLCDWVRVTVRAPHSVCCRIKPLRVNAYVNADIIQGCISGIQESVVTRFSSAMLKCDRYFDNECDFRAWLAEVGETSSSFKSDRLEFM